MEFGVDLDARPTSAAARVARSLLHDGPQTAPDLADRLGLTAQAIRRHLDHLLSLGYIAAHERPPFGPAPRRGRGRPPKVYSVTESGRSHLHQNYDGLALAALQFIRRSGGPDLVDGFAESLAADFRDRYAGRITRAADPVAELAQAMTEEGYAAEVVDDGGGLPGVQVCQHHCPVAAIAAEFPQLCAAETAAIGELLGRSVTRLATIAHGDGVCTTHISPAVTTGVPASLSPTRKASA